MGFVVGNGHDIHVRVDNWLSTSKPMAIGPPTFINQQPMVKDLMNPNHQRLGLARKLGKHLPQDEENIDYSSQAQPQKIE
uniref:Uncharacterized protein n=1 Tax=Brassica oleracea TaxID=3712 RepID=A0A3P6BAZ8_BRAOL|nr:unnamed protein product [Brassica oleracea]